MKDCQPLILSRTRAYFEVFIGVFLFLISPYGLAHAIQDSSLGLVIIYAICIAASLMLIAIGLRPFLGSAPKLILREDGIVALRHVDLKGRFFSWADLGPFSIREIGAKGQTTRILVADYKQQKMAESTVTPLFGERPSYLTFPLHHTEQNKNDAAAQTLLETCEAWRLRFSGSTQPMITKADIHRFEKARRSRGIIALVGMGVIILAVIVGW